MVDGQLTHQKLEWIQSRFTRCRSIEHAFRGRESLSRTLMNSEPRLDAQVAMQSGTTREDRHIQIDAGGELRKASGRLRMERRGWIGEKK